MYYLGIFILILYYLIIDYSIEYTTTCITTKIIKYTKITFLFYIYTQKSTTYKP